MINSISRIDFFAIVIFVGLDATTAQNKEKEIEIYKKMIET